MGKIPPKLKREILADPYYKHCARAFERDCEGRITFEHAIIFGGKQLNERFAILPLCEYHHAVGQHQEDGDLKKEINVWMVLNRASEEELQMITKAIDYATY